MLFNPPVVLVEVDLVVVLSSLSGLNPGGKRPDKSSFLMSPNRLARESLGTPEDLVVVGSLVVVVLLVVEGGCSFSSGLTLKPGGRNWATLSNLMFCRLCKGREKKNKLLHIFIHALASLRFRIFKISSNKRRPINSFPFAHSNPTSGLPKCKAT